MRKYILVLGPGPRQMLEDLIEILEGKGFEANRRTLVLQSQLCELKKVEKGLSLTNQGGFFVGAENSNAFNAFLALDQKLKPYNPSWAIGIPLIIGALEKLLRGDEIDQNERKVSIKLFTPLLEQMQLENFRGISQMPQKFSFAS